MFGDLWVGDIIMVGLQVDPSEARSMAARVGIPYSRRLKRVSKSQLMALVRLLESHEGEISAPPQLVPQRPVQPVQDLTEWASWWKDFGPPWDIEELDGAIAAMQDRLSSKSTRSSFQELMTLAVLGGALLARYQLHGDPQSLNEADAVLREVQQQLSTQKNALTTNTIKIVATVNLANVNIALFRATGETLYLYQAHGILLSALDRSLTGHLAIILSLVEVERLIFDATGDQEMLAAAIESAGRALEAERSYAAESALATCLMTRYEVEGSPHDLYQAIALLSDALGRLPSDAPEYPIVESNLARALYLRQDANDLEQATDLLRDALARTGKQSPYRKAIETNALNLAAAAAG